MIQIQYKVSELIDKLSDRLKGHKLILSKSEELFDYDLQFVNLEKGLYFLTAKVAFKKRVKFLQVAEALNDWTLIYYLENDLNTVQEKLSAGIYTGFNNVRFETILEANTEANLHVIMLQRDYLKIYDLYTMFENIKKQDKHINYQPMFVEMGYKLKCFETNMGPIRIKQNIFQFISFFRFNEEKIGELLKKDITMICENCLEQRTDIYNYLSNVYKYELRSLEIYFFNIFGKSIIEYYKNFQIESLRRFLKNNEVLDEFLLNYIKKYSTCLKELTAKFGLSVNSIRELFFEEFGESLYIYHQNFRLKVAKESLKNNKMKVYQVSESLGYKQTSKFVYFIKRHEGLTPSQLFKSKMKTKPLDI